MFFNISIDYHFAIIAISNNHLFVLLPIYYIQNMYKGVFTRAFVDCNIRSSTALVKSLDAIGESKIRPLLFGVNVK